jgi:hypothetical protein
MRSTPRGCASGIACVCFLTRCVITDTQVTLIRANALFSARGNGAKAKVLRAAVSHPLVVTLMTAAIMSASPAYAGQSAQPATALLQSTKSNSSDSSLSIRDIVSELRRFHDESRAETEVPPTVSRNLTQLKQSLRDLIVDTAGAPNAITADPDALGRQVIRRLEGDDIPVGDLGDYGAIRAISFRRPPEYPSWLVVTATLGIPYGEDTSLYLFEIDGTSWKPVLILESNGYREISGAQGWMTYYVSPVIQGKKPYLITAEVTPWNVSVWQGLRVRVLRVGKNPDHPILLAKRTLSYCLDDTYYVAMRTDGFGLIFLGNPVDRELAGYRGVHYLQGTVSENSASLKEIAIDPSNFMNRWSARGWTTDSHLIDEPANDDLREWHRRFRQDRWTCGPGATLLDHRGQGEDEQLLVVLECVRYDHTDPEAYVTLSAGRNGFRIASITSSRAAPESMSESVYFAGGPGITDPVPKRVVQPTPPPSISPSSLPFKQPLGIVVNEDGTVGDVTVLDWPDDQHRMVVPAIQAVKLWKYKPGSLNGTPVKVSIHVEVAFEP